jgi:hypothetical protein
MMNVPLLRVNALMVLIGKRHIGVLNLQFSTVKL